jgi:hypothetical protein
MVDTRLSAKVNSSVTLGSSPDDTIMQAQDEAAMKGS